MLELGWSAEAIGELADASQPKARTRALRWVWGLETRRREVDGREVGGRNRGHRVKHCGVAYPCMLESGRITIRARTCRDRACPACMVRRSRDYGAALRLLFESRAASRGSSEPFAFVTLTQPKRHIRAEGAADAVSRLLSSWSDLTSTRLAIGRGGRKIFTGAVRSIECVWSGRGKAHRNGHGRVRFTGWHAHAHAMFELSEGVTVAELELHLETAWQWCSPGASTKALDVQTLDRDAVGQVAKYVSKPFDLPQKRARELFIAVEGRRMIEGVGTLKGWRKYIPEKVPEDKVVAWGECSIGTLGERWAKYRQRGRGRSPDNQRYLMKTQRGETVRNVSESDLISSLRADANAR